MVLTSQQKGSRQLSLRTWNVLVLASISRDLPQSAQALLRHFPAFAATFHDSLVSPATLGPTESASTINHSYISIKLWLLLSKKLSDAALEPAHASNVLTFRFWNELWPPFLRVLAMLMTGAGPSSVSGLYKQSTRANEYACRLWRVSRRRLSRTCYCSCAISTRSSTWRSSSKLPGCVSCNRQLALRSRTRR